MWSSLASNVSSNLVDAGSREGYSKLPSISRASYALANRRDSRATYPAVCDKQVTLRCNADPLNGVIGTEQADEMLGGQLFGPRGLPLLNIWIAGRPIRGCFEGATAERPCRSRALSIDPSHVIALHPERRAA